MKSPCYCEIELLQKELGWHLTHLRRVLKTYLNEAQPQDAGYPLPFY